MNRREFFIRFIGISAILAGTDIVATTTPAWIQKTQKVVIRSLNPGDTHTTLIQFAAEPGDYAEVTSNAGAYDLMVSSGIDDNGDVVISTYNPGIQSVSAAIEFTVRLYKM